MLPIRRLNEELQKIAIEELNENPDSIWDYVELLREWAERQQHLTIRTDAQHLVTLLRGCKYDVEMVKQKIETLCTVRTAYPDLFKNRDPFLPEMQELLNYGICLPFIKTKSPGGPRVSLGRLSDADPFKIKPQHALKLLLMIKDVLINEDDNYIVGGDQLIFDFKGARMSHTMLVSPVLARIAYKVIHDAYAGLPRGNYSVNVPKFGASVYNNLVRHLIRTEHRKLVKIYYENGPKELHDLVGSSVLPPEYDGRGDNLEVLTAHWKNKIESYRDWYIDDEQYCADETKRPKKSAFRWFRRTSFGE